MIVGVNKMDATEPPFSEARFKEIKKQVKDYMKKIGYYSKAIAFVPISGWHGDNICEVTYDMPWYRGWSIEHKGIAMPITGKTLYDAINSIMPPQR